MLEILMMIMSVLCTLFGIYFAVTCMGWVIKRETREEEHAQPTRRIAAVIAARNEEAVIGEMLPRKNFDYTAFPYRQFRWEKSGKFYRMIQIQKWKDRVPDMSKYVKTMFAKQIVNARDPEYTRRLILETCVAELIHYILMLISPVFTEYMTGIYGSIASYLYILGNLPFIVIQRYNRPRFLRLMQKYGTENTERMRATQ